MRFVFICFLGVVLSTSVSAQGFWFGPKAGPTLATQKWNAFDQQVLLDWHIAAFVETVASETAEGSLFAQLGYHSRGSSIRFQGFNGTGLATRGFVFRNLSLMAGAKKFLPERGKSQPYYFVGVRLEYTVDTNLDELDPNFAGYYPFEPFVNKWNYGISVGGGYKFTITEKVGAFVDLTISPDLSFQYQQPAIGNVPTPFGGSIVIPERQIRNVSLEITFGLNFLRKVVYE